MSNAVKTDNIPAADDAPKTESSTGSYVVAGLIVLGILAVAAYQFFGCASCY
jgi:hypothetical protein